MRKARLSNPKIQI